MTDSSLMERNILLNDHVASQKAMNCNWKYYQDVSYVHFIFTFEALG